MSTGDIITILLALIGSGVVVTIGGYKISVGVSKAVQPVIDQVNTLTTTMAVMHDDISAHDVMLNTLTPTADINLLAGNVYDSSGQLVFEAELPHGCENS